MGRLRGLGGKLVDMAPDRFPLPAEPLDGFGVILKHEQLIYKPRDYVRAKRESRRSLAVLLTLEPGPFEERFVGENLR